jgi:hypothetical protein
VHAGRVRVKVRFRVRFSSLLSPVGRVRVRDRVWVRVENSMLVEGLARL